MTSVKKVSLREYINEVLKNATYEVDHSLSDGRCIVAEAVDLPGCLTQGDNFEEARENLIDAIELWIMAGLKAGEEMPIVNGCQLIISSDPPKQQAIAAKVEENLG